MQKRKLNRHKLSKLWEEGGREPSKWCNQYLIKKGENYLLVEEATWYCYLVYLLSLPLILAILLLTFLYKTLEKTLMLVDKPIRPLAAAHLSLFTKKKYRTDLIYSNEVTRYDDC